MRKPLCHCQAWCIEVKIWNRAKRTEQRKQIRERIRTTGNSALCLTSVCPPMVAARKDRGICALLYITNTSCLGTNTSHLCVYWDDGSSSRNGIFGITTHACSFAQTSENFMLGTVTKKTSQVKQQSSKNLHHDSPCCIKTIELDSKFQDSWTFCPFNAQKCTEWL